MKKDSVETIIKQQKESGWEFMVPFMAVDEKEMCRQPLRTPTLAYFSGADCGDNKSCCSQAS